MENSFPPISPELIALVDNGDGIAEVIDPATKRVFVITEQRPPHPCAHPETDDELRTLLNAASEQIDRGEVCELSTDQILAEARRRAEAAG